MMISSTKAVQRLALFFWFSSSVFISTVLLGNQVNLSTSYLTSMILRYILYLQHRFGFKRNFSTHVRIHIPSLSYSVVYNIRRMCCVDFLYKAFTLVSLWIFCVSYRGLRTPFWGSELSPSWMPASSRKGRSSERGEPAGPWLRDGPRVRNANRRGRHWHVGLQYPIHTAKLGCPGHVSTTVSVTVKGWWEKRMSEPAHFCSGWHNIVGIRKGIHVTYHKSLLLNRHWYFANVFTFLPLTWYAISSCERFILGAQLNP